MDINIQNAILDLIIAIQEDNMDITVECVSFLNNNIKAFINDTQILYLNSLLSLERLINTHPNESLLYVLTYLKPLLNTEQYKWIVKVNLLMKENNKENIKSFVEEILENSPEDIVISYKFYGLIQLVTSIQDYDLIYKIKALINN